jgi:predicted RNase H-like HicB family nuclease
MSEIAIRLHVEPLENGGYLATSPDVPGLVAEGRSIVETVEIAQGLVRKIAESCLEHGDSLPPSLSHLVDGGTGDFVIPVMLVPSSEMELPDAKRLMREMLACRDQVKRTLTGVSVRELKEEGRRY